MRKTLRIIFYTTATIAFATMVLGLFMLGHTERFSTTATLTMAAISGTCALIAGILQWVGLPAAPEAPKQSGRKSRRPPAS